MEQKSCHRLIYKIHTKQLKKANWDIVLDLYTIMRKQPDCVVALNDSQVLRFIDEINGVHDLSNEVSQIFSKIRAEKKKPRTKETKIVIKSLYDALYNAQFQADYICIIMDGDSDYDRANLGFKVNGIPYRRLLGTNGGIKNSTIVYVSERVYPEIKKRMDNGRDMSKQLVPAKLEAYQALICSGSTPIPEPNGIIVINDCITHFKENVIMINDEADGEPVMTKCDDYDIEHNCSDGYGIMTPAYSRRVNEYLSGDGGHEIAGMNTRYAWTKGMLYTFDFVDFADKNGCGYFVTDAWGQQRDIRNAEVILTVSMLKLWDSYGCWEDYHRNCQENHYQFSTPKVTPDKLENVRDTNYQFLQSYTFTDDEIVELCKPTFDEINDALGLDWRKSLTLLAGYSITEDNAFNDTLDYSVRALMANKDVINDSFVRRRIWNMLERRIEMAKRGAIRINANFAMISGDPYALCQSMFGLNVTGILSKGEVYHKYWADKGAKEIVCFRAPMTCHNNIRKMRVCARTDAMYWFRYMNTVCIFNSWDCSCDAMNGADFDGDTNMCTDNAILLRNTLNSPTIMCVQRKAEKKIPTESDIIQANKIAFNDDIGAVTNRVTSMIEVQSNPSLSQEEHDILTYRIMCGQLFQQNTIDRAKGIIAKPMPTYWYNARELGYSEDDTPEQMAEKDRNRRIVASKKPHFMIHVYPSLKSQESQFNKSTKSTIIRKLSQSGIRDIVSLQQCKNRSEEAQNILDRFENNKVTGDNPCVVNKICWLAEKEFSGFSKSHFSGADFDSSILKSNVGYSNAVYNEIYKLYLEYKSSMIQIQSRINTSKAGKRADIYERAVFLMSFRTEATKLCTCEDELCDIVVDMCYNTESMKSFAWDIAGDVMINNLLRNSNGSIQFPLRVSGRGDFEFCGREFIMCSKEVEYEQDNT